MLQNKRKRSISRTERFFMIAFIFYGIGKAAREIINLAASLEKLANETAEGFTKVNAETVAIRTVAMQNRVALDVLLAA